MDASEKQAPDDDAQPTLPLYRWEGRALGIAWKNVNVWGAAQSTQQIDDLGNILRTCLKWPFDIGKRYLGGQQPAGRRIIQDSAGVLFPGETLLVLGNPGAGCSTTLKVIANSCGSYKDVRGERQYGTLSPGQIARDYQSEVVYNGEEDIHIPMLKVKDTMDFALRLRRPPGDRQPEKNFSASLTDSILQALGIVHTKDTIVGNAFVRGVSGGERKRISLAEVLATNPSIACWDNPIRGLDSSSALSFLRTLREISQAVGMTNAVSLYQASETMYYTCFDKVVVLYEGRMIYFGPVTAAKEYFTQLGFKCHPRQTTPEFLTAVTSPRERRIRSDYAGPLYLDPDSLAGVFRQSSLHASLLVEIERYKKPQLMAPLTEKFQQEVKRTVSKLRLLSTIEPSPMIKQISVSLVRYFRLAWNDRNTLLTIITLSIVNALVCGSGFYDAPRTATGSFERSCALYFPLVYFFLNALTEVNKTVDARNILLKQHKLGLMHPASYVITQSIGDIPSSFIQTLIFSCCYYFIVGLNRTASQFWIFVLITFVHYCSVSAMFRMLGAWAPNLSIALLMTGSSIPIVTLYAGYAPPRPTMLRWGSWMRRVAPTPYALEALMSNEFYNIQLHCTEDQLVPSGANYQDLSHQGCPLSGAEPGSVTTSGAYYLWTLYEYTRDHLWQNFGIIIVMWFLYNVLAAVGLTIMTRETNRSSSHVFKAGAVVPKPTEPRADGSDNDIEKQEQLPGSGRHSLSLSDANMSKDDEQQIPTPEDEAKGLLTFEDINYSVTVDGKPRKLLDGVSGYVRAGQLTALMGASGAGKTTLLDTLSQRKSDGTVDSTILMNAQPVDTSFSRSCGFCMQQDIHEPLTTVREALQFSAYLRQPAEVSNDEKMAYVEHIISLLELDPIADAIIGEADDGKLGVEERKRVTIGVELAARPSALLFLDEPTSGLDSQAAYSIVSFLRRIAAEGIPVVCTIHQPSGVIFEMFDHVLLLAPGGKTVYFGETGVNSTCLTEYFARSGAVMKDDENPAEFILGTVTDKSDTRDWVQIWRDSPEATNIRQRIIALKQQKQKVSGHSEQTVASPDSKSTYAQPFRNQVYAVTKRHWITIWRHGPYNFGRLFKCIFYELVISFTFFHAATDLQSLQNRMLGVLLMTWIITVNAADMQAVWFERWAIFEGRERNGIYDYKALVLAMIAVEVPWNILLYTIVFLCSYWTIGFENSPTIAGFTYFMFLLLSQFGTGFCYLMASFFPSRTMAGYANSLFWVVLLIFCGLPVPHSGMNDFYRPWLFWADPLRYFFGGSISSVMHKVNISCKPRDYAQFIPPANQTCQQYAADFLSTNAGYLVNPDGADVCNYCEFSTGDDYLDTLDFAYADRWRDWAVFLGFCITNFVLVFFGTWLLRVKVREIKSRFGKK